MIIPQLFLLVLLSIIVLIITFKWYKRYQVKKRLCQKRDIAFKGLRVVITGGSSGIGEELAYRYACGGAKVVIAARNETELLRVKEACLTKHGNDQVYICVADMSKSEDCKKLVDKSLVYLDGTIDLLILNAGIGSLQRFRDIESLDGHRKVMEVNYWGPVTTTFHALPFLKKQANGAKIVVVSSIMGQAGNLFRTAYSASKFALRGFYDCLRLELLNEGCKKVQIQIICPGFVKTPILLRAMGKNNENIKRDLSYFMSVEECVNRMLICMEEGQFMSSLETLGFINTYAAPYLPQFLFDMFRIKIALQVANPELSK